MFYQFTAFFLLVFCASNASSASNSESNSAMHRTFAFLFDYFDSKPFMLTMNVCWKHREISSFLQKDIRSTHPKQLAVFQNDTSNKFMSHLSNNNYFVLDMKDECTSSWEIMKFINETLAFRFPLKFMLLVSNEVFDSLIAVLSNYSVLPSTELTVVKQGSDNEDFELWQPYKIDMDHPIILEKYGIWNETGLYSFINKTNLQTRRHDFQQTQMKVVFYIEFEETWQHLEDFRRPRIDTFTKQNFGAIKALMEYCNINFIMVPVKIWGYFNETTQSFNGLIEKVAKREVVLAGSSPYFTIERFRVVDFIKMQNHLEIKFIMKKPPLSYMYNVYTLPFQSNVWKALLVVILLFFGAMYLILNWETKKIEAINSRNKFSTSDVSLIMCEAVCQQGSTIETKTITGRILEFIMYLAFFFLYSSYSAYIVVILQSTYTIADYQELYDSSMGAGGMETSYMRVYLAGSKNVLQQKLYNKKIGPKGFYSLEEGIQKVQQGFFAFHGEVAASYNYIAKTFTDYDICNLQIMEGYSSYLKGYTSVPKNSPYKEIFKVALMKIDEYGIQKRNYIRYAEEPRCHGGGGSFGSVGIRDMYNALLILAAGLALAVGLLILECLFHIRQQRILRREENFQKRAPPKYEPRTKLRNW